MNKADLIDKTSALANVTKKQADAVLTASLSIIMNAVASGDKVTLVGFGIFERRDRKARAGRNPKTQEILVIPATRTPGFSAGKLFKQKLRSEKSDQAETAEA